ncbi:MAG: hypothetical protein JNM31_00775 [Flavobacteriales bacterium]|nr:hypothetical protein [Flavobacteriales bacterium]
MSLIDERLTIELETTGLDLLDLSGPILDEERGAHARAVTKRIKWDAAFSKTMDRLYMTP